MTANTFLPAGEYFFEELQGVPGYEVDAKSRAIKIEIPDSWESKRANSALCVKLTASRCRKTWRGGDTGNDRSGYPQVYNYADKQRRQTGDQTAGPSTTQLGNHGRIRTDRNASV